MSDDSDVSNSSDESEESFYEESEKEFSEHMHSLVSDLITRLNNALKLASESNVERDKLITTGEILLNNVRDSYPTIVEQEELLTDWVNLVTRVVEENSDHQSTFWEASYFFQLIIENYSVKVVLDTVKACVAIYNTEHTSDNVVSGWASAATKRCAQWIKVQTPEELSNNDILTAIKSVNTILQAVAEAGEEYQDIIKADTDLKDSLAELNLLLEQSSAGGSVFSAANKAAVAAIKKEVVKIEALSSDSAEGIIVALEQAVDLAKPSGDPFFQAYNAMCEQQPADLQMQVRAARGPLAKMAVQALNNQTEHKQGKKRLFSESLSFCQLLLQPWQRDDPRHMEAKLQIATSLQELGITSALLKHFQFWVEHKFGYGDCGDPALLCLVELVRFFPNIISDNILPDADAVAFIRHVAEVDRNDTTYKSRESGGRAAVVLEALLDGKPEPPPEPEKTKRGGKGYGYVEESRKQAAEK